MESAEVKAKCPQCGASMVLRLGILECSGCGYEMQPPEPEPEEADDENRPLERREGWQLPKGRKITSSNDEFTSFKQGLKEMTQRQPGKTYNVAPGLGAEKIIVICLLAGMGALNVYAPWQGTGLIWSFTAVTWQGALAIELVRTALTVAVLYIPFMPIKWTGIGFSLIGIGISIVNLFLIANNRELIFFGMPIGLNASLFEMNLWLMYCLSVVVFVAVAGVLGKDIYRMNNQ